MDAPAFADEIDRLLNLYHPNITQTQFNLLDSHDMPRFLTCVGNDKSALKLAWLFLMTIPGAPSIYYGDEIGLDGRHDPECRKSFPWDKSRWDQDLFDYLKGAITLRKDNPALRRGALERLWSENGVYSFGRTLDGESLIVALNASEEPRTIEVPCEAKKNLKVVFGQLSNVTVINDRLKFTVPARSGGVLK
jgi:glycosidase